MTGTEDHTFPRISIITVVYNGMKYIERTMNSVLNQTYSDIEYLLIDGGSTDGTVDCIKKYADRIDHWQSEPDRGIYDAMNKGLEKATGEYVWFINAGDEIYAPETVERIGPLLRERADSYYGETLFIDETGGEAGIRSGLTPHRLPENLTWRHFNKGMVVSHQSFIVRREIAPGYDFRFPHSGDIDWIIRCLKRGRESVHTRTILSRYLMGGHSKKFHLRSLFDRYRVLQRHFGVVPNFLNHIGITARAVAGKRLTGT
jgi:glycosyltransferase involved in cell wall biosynthesis